MLSHCSNPEQRQRPLTQGNPCAEKCCRRAAKAVARAFAWAFAWLLLTTACAASAASSCESSDVGEPLVLHRVGVDVWRIDAARGEPLESNRGVTIQSLLARDGARLWLIGSGPTPAFGAALACAVRRTLGGAVTDVVNTRAAPGLAMGNVAFDGARLWALPDVMAAMRVRCEACRERLATQLGAAGASLQAAPIHVPSVPIARQGVSAGRLGPFAWRALERAPGERVLVLRHRASGLVIAQGLLWADDVPDLRDTRSDTLLASLRALDRFSRGARLLGEQGGVAGPSAVAAHIAYIEAVRSAVEEMLSRGDVQGASGVGIELPAFAALPGYAERHVLNVQHVWRELELRSFDAAPMPSRGTQSGRSPTFQRSLR